MVTDPIKAELTKSRPEEGRTGQIGGLRLGARAGRPPLGSVRSGEARTLPIRTRHRTISTSYSQDTILQDPDSEACGPWQRRSRGQVYSAEPPVALFITSSPTDSGMESRRATPGQPESSHLEGPSRSETDCWVLPNVYLPLYPGFGL